MGRIPDDRPDDPENVADALAVARARLQSGDVADAVRWVRRAADAAFDASEDQRGLELSKAALALTEDPPAPRLATAAPPPLPPPLPPLPSPQPAVSSVPPPLPSARPEAPKAPASATASAAPPLPATNRVVNHAPRLSSPPRHPEATVVPPRRAARRNTRPPRPQPRPAAPSIEDDAATRVRPSPLADPPPTPFSRDESTTIIEMEALLAAHAPSPPPPDPPAPVAEVSTAVTVAPTQALRVALRREGATVTVRALGPDGLRDGEREVMLVALDLATDLASLLKP